MDIQDRTSSTIYLKKIYRNYEGTGRTGQQIFTVIGRVWRVEYDDNIDFCRGYNAATTFLNFQKRSIMTIKLI
jgi:hypothetical protein